MASLDPPRPSASTQTLLDAIAGRPSRMSIWGPDDRVPQDHLDMAKDALARGADINWRRSDGLTPLMIAVRHGSARCVDLLLGLPACDVEAEAWDANGGQRTDALREAKAWMADGGKHPAQALMAGQVASEFRRRGEAADLRGLLGGEGGDAKGSSRL